MCWRRAGTEVFRKGAGFGTAALIDMNQLFPDAATTPLLCGKMHVSSLMENVINVQHKMFFKKKRKTLVTKGKDKKLMNSATEVKL